MRSIPIFLIAFLVSLTVYPQSLCYENSEGEYWPFDLKERKFYISDGEYTLAYSTDSLEINGQYYVTRTKKFKDGKLAKDYFRNEIGAIYYYSNRTNSESLALPSKIEKGEKWESADKKWEYKIKSLNATLSTPYCELTNLLEIESFNKDSKKRYQSFYKKGVGFVGSNIEDKPHSFIEPNGKVEEKNFTAVGCENVENDTQREICTNNKIIEFVLNNLKNPTPRSHGKVVYQIRLDTEGKVAEVTIKESHGVSKQQIESGLKTLRNLPQFIPAHSGQKPVGVIFSLPLAF